MPGDADELIVFARREAAREVFLLLLQDVDRELARFGDRDVRAEYRFDADQHQRGLERERREGADGHPVEMSLVRGRHHRHAAGEVAEGLAEAKFVDRHTDVLACSLRSWSITQRAL